VIPVIKTKTSFRPALADVLREGAYARNAKPGETHRILHATVPGEDAATLAAGLGNAAEANHRVRVRAAHIVLSPMPGEWLTDDRWRELVADFLEAMDYGGHEYVLVLHEWPQLRDVSQHAHIIVSRVGPLRVRRTQGGMGTVVNAWGDWWRAERTLDRLEAEYGLVATRATGQALDAGRRRERGA
jgi:hypothetical protein